MRIIHGDCLDVLRGLGDCSVDSVVTDPPYELGFMGKGWDMTGVAYSVEVWGECLRVLKPGGHLLSFGGTRTYHRMVCAIEDAGFEIRDMIEWCYGSGFPKSLNIGKAVDKRGGTTSDQSKEFAEYIKNRRNELNITLSKADEVICGGTTNYSWFEGRPAGQRLPRKADYLKMKELLKLDDRYDSFMEETEREVLGFHPTIQGSGSVFNVPFENGRPLLTKGTSEWEGWGTALKPAHEPICLARKPLSEKTVAENCLKWGVGGINIDGCRVVTNDKINSVEGGIKRRNKINQEQGFRPYINGFDNQDKEIWEQNSQGRFPANLIHDGSDEVRECFTETKTGWNNNDGKYTKTKNYNVDFGGARDNQTGNHYLDNSGNASRFFKSIIYQAKASKGERKLPEGNYSTHPTVKPVELMAYLVRLVTPKGGTVLDPFGGSGTTGVACLNEGMHCIIIEKEEKYVEIIKSRLKQPQQLKIF